MISRTKKRVVESSVMLHHEALACRHGGRQKEQGAAVTVAQTTSPASAQHPGQASPWMESCLLLLVTGQSGT